MLLNSGCFLSGKRNLCIKMLQKHVKKTWKKEILASVRSAQDPNAGQNILQFHSDMFGV